MGNNIASDEDEDNLILANLSYDENNDNKANTKKRKLNQNKNKNSKNNINNIENKNKYEENIDENIQKKENENENNLNVSKNNEEIIDEHEDEKDNDNNKFDTNEDKEEKENKASMEDKNSNKEENIKPLIDENLKPKTEENNNESININEENNEKKDEIKDDQIKKENKNEDEIKKGEITEENTNLENIMNKLDEQDEKKIENGYEDKHEKDTVKQLTDIDNSNSVNVFPKESSPKTKKLKLKSTEENVILSNIIENNENNENTENKINENNLQEKDQKDKAIHIKVEINDQNLSNEEKKEVEIDNKNDIKKEEDKNEKVDEGGEEEVGMDPTVEKIKNESDKTNSLTKKLDDIIFDLKKEIQNNHNKELQYKKRINDINKDINAQKEIKANINKDMVNLENIISYNLNRIKQITKKNRGRESVERGKRELFIYESSEEILNVKQKQLKNIAKTDLIFDNDISKINNQLQKGYYVDQEIKEENPSIKTKEEELIYTLNKINTNINALKNEILILKGVKGKHENNCDKKLKQLNKELENLREKKKRNLEYVLYLGKNKEINRIKKEKVEAFRNKERNNENRPTFNTERKDRERIRIRNKNGIFITEENIYDQIGKTSENYDFNDIEEEEDYLNTDLNQREPTSNLKISNNKNKNKSESNINDGTEGINKRYNEEEDSSNNIITDVNNNNNNDDNNNNNSNEAVEPGKENNSNENKEEDNNNNDLNYEKEYKKKLNAMIKEKNEYKRKKNNEVQKLISQNKKLENDIKELEEKKLKIQNKYIDLKNAKIINSNKIKKLNKQIEDLKYSEENYEKQIKVKNNINQELKKFEDFFKFE